MGSARSKCPQVQIIAAPFEIPKLRAVNKILLQSVRFRIELHDAVRIVGDREFARRVRVNFQAVGRPSISIDHVPSHTPSWRDPEHAARTVYSTINEIASASEMKVPLRIEKQFGRLARPIGVGPGRARTPFAKLIPAPPKTLFLCVKSAARRPWVRDIAFELFLPPPTTYTPVN